MSIYGHPNYSIVYPKAGLKQKEFMKYIALKIREDLDKKYKMLFDTEFEEEVTIKLELEELPSRFRPKRAPNLSPFLGSKEAPSKLERFNPLSFKETQKPLHLEIVLNNELPYLIKSFKIFKVGGIYFFGISINSFYKDTPFLLSLIFREIDFGSQTGTPLHFFYPIFKKYRFNLDYLFKEFLAKEATKDGKFI